MLSERWRGSDDDIDEGVLTCGVEVCQRVYPVVDGLPILVADLRGWMERHAHLLLRRRDLARDTEALILECLGPESPWEYARALDSGYAAAHWGQEAALASLVRGAFALRAPDDPGVLGVGAGPPADPTAGPALDIGCGPGAGTFVLAERCAGPVLGVDLNPSLLRIARDASRGRVRFERRIEGLVYETIDLAVPAEHGDRLDFWVADAAAMPFPDQSFGTVSAIHTLDSVADPLALLVELHRVLPTGGEAVLSCSFDWSAAATPLERWLSGHGARGLTGGRGAATLRHLLPRLGLHIVAEDDGALWSMPSSARVTVQSRVQRLRVRKG